MNIMFQIRQLWRYLKIQDDEILIIPFYNPATQNDQYIVAEKKNARLEILTLNNMPELSSNKAFKIIQHIGSDGKHIIPSVKQMKRDEKKDY